MTVEELRALIPSQGCTWADLDRVIGGRHESNEREREMMKKINKSSKFNDDGTMIPRYEPTTNGKGHKRICCRDIEWTE